MMAVRWVVRQGDGTTVGEVLARAGADTLALREGRVFVGRRRAKRPDEPLAPDDVVEVADPREPPVGARVLLRTDDLVAVDKPAGVPTIADHGGGAHALVSLTAKELRVDPSRLHPTSRLDRDVSGVVVMALTAAAARRLAEARSRGTYLRRYVAIGSRAPSAEAGSWDAAIGRASDPRRRKVDGRDAVAAATRYVTCARAAGGAALLAITPLTGRTHQIRVHAAHAGAPLVGDRAYGGPARVTLPGGRVLQPRRVALHAAKVTVPDAHGAPLVVAAPVPDDLRSLWTAMGGSDTDWEIAISCDV